MLSIYKDLTISSRQNIEKWCENLESGKFGQTNGQLGIGEKENIQKGCCLGIASETFRCETGQGKWFPYSYVSDEEGRLEFVVDDEHESFQSAMFMIRPVQQWFGFDNDDPILTVPLKKGNRGYSAAELNDNQKLSFVKIAKIIRHNVLGEDIIKEGDELYKYVKQERKLDRG